MLFNSIQFLIFFPIVWLIYFIVPNKLKMYCLLTASYYFYMCWNAKYALLILFSTIVTYVSGILIEKVKHTDINEIRKIKRKKIIAVLCFLLNLSVLFYFKYINFALEAMKNLFSVIHIQLNVPFFDIILPVGISFYTFQALSYTMDVYRDEIYAERNFFKYALFVSFFPQLVAGPIERSKNLLRQLTVSKKFSFEAAREGFLLMLWGYFLKIVLADRIAIFVNTVYENFNDFGGVYLIVATILFAFQIYCDFCGYSIIAMGAAKMIGIQLMENFDSPYLATSVAEFWRRWHISLTSWFRDYLYFPLGGSKKGKLRKYLNKMIVFLVSGLWHGADFSFIIWGGLNGLYQITGEIFMPLRDRLITLCRLNRKSIGHRLLSMLTTFLLIDFSWIFFRADGFRNALMIIKQMIQVYNPWVLFDGSLYNCGLNQKNFHLMLICIAILIAADICKYCGIKVRDVIIRQDYWCRWIVISMSVFLILLFGVWGPGYDEVNFIYFQF